MTDNIIKINDRQPRKYSFLLPNIESGCADNIDKEIQVIFFLKDYKFRSHLVRHFLNTYEYENAFSKVNSKCGNFFSEVITELQKIHCPYMEGPTNGVICKYCNEFKDCTEIIAKAEPFFLEIIETVILNAIENPRFSLTSNTYKKTKTISFVSDFKVCAKAHFIESGVSKGSYNLMTCYGQDYSGSLNEFIKKVKARIKNEYNSEDREFCSKNGWLINENWKEQVMREEIFIPEDIALLETLITRRFK